MTELVWNYLERGSRGEKQRSANCTPTSSRVVNDHYRQIPPRPLNEFVDIPFYFVRNLEVAIVLLARIGDAENRLTAHHRRGNPMALKVEERFPPGEGRDPEQLAFNQ